MNEYRIVSWSDLYSGDWVVLRTLDWRIMTQGSIITCTRWVNTWGPVSSAKRGTDLSPRALGRIRAD